MRAGNTAQKVVRRARIALLAGEGLKDSQISQELGVNRKTVALWRECAAEPGGWEPVMVALPQGVRVGFTSSPPKAGRVGAWDLVLWWVELAASFGALDLLLEMLEILRADP